mgnify:CR=1 FL=1|jgi:hypothetical protein
MKIDKILTILQKTNDGNDLSPEHLKLVELGVNGYLNQAGLAALDSLYESVEAGTYTKPYHLGVEFMTRDHEGFIYFKDKQVEHYSSPWANSLEARACLIKLQHQCLYLESVNDLTGPPYMLCNYGMKGRHGEHFCEHEKQTLDRLCGENGIVFSQVHLPHNSVTDDFLLSGSVNQNAVADSPEYREMLMAGDVQPPCSAMVTVFSYGAGPLRNATAQELDTLNCCLDYMVDHALLKEHSKAEYDMLAENTLDADEEYER